MIADAVTAVVWGLLGLTGLSLVFLIAKVALGGPKKSRRSEDVDQPTAIDIPALDEGGPPVAGPQLQIYGTAVRLAVLVIAPVGRDGRLPPRAQLAGLMDNLVPGLMSVIGSHQPLFRRWPQQLSSQGFMQSFFNNMALPGDRGKGSPWCSVAGRFESNGEQYLAGFVCCGHKANGLSECSVEHAGQWLDVVRIQANK